MDLQVEPFVEWMIMVWWKCVVSYWMGWRAGCLRSTMIMRRWCGEGIIGMGRGIRRWWRVNSWRGIMMRRVQRMGGCWVLLNMTRIYMIRTVVVLSMRMVHWGASASMRMEWRSTRVASLWMRGWLCSIPEGRGCMKGSGLETWRVVFSVMRGWREWVGITRRRIQTVSWSVWVNMMSWMCLRMGSVLRWRMGRWSECVFMRRVRWRE